MALQVGDPAPDFTMPTVSGGTVSLNDLRGKKVVLYFYPKDDTPGCTIEACSFRDNLPNFQGANAEIIGVSRDNTESHQAFRDKYALNFTLASDDTGSVTEAFGVWREKNMYGKTFMGIQRSTFLIDENGNIQKIWPSVSVDGHSKEVLAAINGEEEASIMVPAKPKPAAAPKMKALPKAVPKKAAAKPKVKAKAAAKPKAAAKSTRKAPAKKAAAKKTAKKPARKVAAKAAKKPAKKTANKATKKAVARKPAKKAAKPAKRASARPGAARRTAARRPARRTAAGRRR